MSAGPLIKHRVAYLHDPEVGQFYYGPSHPMKPHRMQLAHQLIIGYELHNKMMMYKPHKASDKVHRRSRVPKSYPDVGLPCTSGSTLPRGPLPPRVSGGSAGFPPPPTPLLPPPPPAHFDRAYVFCSPLRLCLVSALGRR